VRGEAVAALVALGARDSWKEIAPLVRDRHPDVREAATLALGRLGVPDAAEALLGIPAEGSARARRAAALALCRLGRRERAEALLLEAPFELNALREPAAWASLLSTPLGADLAGTSVELLERILSRAGLALEVADPAAFRGDDAELRIRWIPGRTGRTRLLDAIEEIFEDLPASRRPRLVLEKDRLRVVTETEARRLWKAWWAGLPK